jgi:hypothetical protein
MSLNRNYKKGIRFMLKLLLCTYISIIPIVLIFCKSIGFDDKLQEFHDYIDCK